MRLICELCEERKLSAIINIHDVLLAQMFAQRIVGLQLGEIVYDGPPSGLTPNVLTQIYGEEDWESTIEQGKEEDDDEMIDGAHEATSVDQQAPELNRDRMAGMT